jgi:transposase
MLLSTSATATSVPLSNISSQRQKCCKSPLLIIKKQSRNKMVNESKELTPPYSINKDVYRLLSDQLENSADARFLHRLHCVFLVRYGLGCSTVAKWFNYSPSTVARWVSHYNKFGVEGLKDAVKPGRPKVLNHDQLNRLRESIARSPRYAGYANAEWDGKCLQHHLETRYEISLSIRQCQRLLRQLRAPST